MRPAPFRAFAVTVLVAAAAASQDSPAPPEPAAPPPPAAAAVALEAALRSRLGQPMEVLDLDLVMFGEDFFGAEPEGVRWSDTSESVIFEWKRWDDPRRGLWVHDLGTGTLERWPDDRPPPPQGVFSHDRKRRAFREGRAVLVEDVTTREVREVLRQDADLSGLQFSADGGSLVFRSGDGVFLLSLDRPQLRQVLALKEGPAPDEAEEKPGDPTKDLAAWHKERQKELFRVLGERGAREAMEKKERKAREAAGPRVVRHHPPEGFKVEGASVSPALTHAAISLVKEGKKPRVAEMPDYVTDDGYVKTRSTRSKAGDDEAERRLEVIDLECGSKVEVKEAVSGSGAWPGGPSWSPDGRYLLASAATRDDEQSFLVSIDPASGGVKILHHLKDDAWVLQHGFPLQWLGDSARAVFLSEASGWTHLYRVDAATGEVRQLTSGEFEVSGPKVAPDGARIWAVATPTSRHVRDLVEIDPDSGEMTIVTADGGGRRIELSPDGTMAAEVFSRANQPWELRVRWLDGGREPVVVTDSPSPAFKSFGKWQEPPIVKIPARDGALVPARIYRPKEPLPGRPAVCFAHGAGHLQNVHSWWSRYSREYAFHHRLSEEGYLVIDIDYRGSAGYGRAWRTAVRRHMGGRDIEDFVDAAKWLAEAEGASPERIGIYGGSYGGFLTLMALFTRPGVFHAGAALRPVTDWAHYNDGYTSNILDRPLESPDAYARSSPIGFAEGLRDQLLICHGLVDDNVHAQDTLRLTQRLIELRKTGWEVAWYPLEGHAFRDAASWSDEYRRIKSLFDRVLRR